MPSRLKTYLVLVPLFLGAFWIGSCLGQVAQGTPTNSSINLQINNPTVIPVKVQVKCDWNWRTKSYVYNKTFVFNTGERKTIKVPRNVKNCEVWPEAKW